MNEDHKPDREIERLKARVEELEAENKRLQNLIDKFDLAPVVLFIKEADSTLIYSNEMDRKILGIKTKTNVGYRNDEIFGPEVARKIHEIEQEAISTRNLITTEEKIKYKNEEHHRIFLTSRGPIIDHEDTVVGIFGVALDISQYQYIKEILTEHRQLSFLRHITRGLTHDFNNILAILLGNISVLSTTALTEDQREIVMALEKATNRGKALIGTIQDYTASGDPKKGPLDINQTIRNICLAFDEEISEKTEIELDLSEKELIVNHISDQVEVAFTNIIQNGLESMSFGGTLLIRTRLVESDYQQNKPLDERIWGLPEGEFVKVEIIDQGKGISEEDYEKIFLPFYSTKPRSKRSGFGFGLSISHKIFLENNCLLFVDSSPDSGSNFTIFIPIDEVKFETISLGFKQVRQ